MQWSKLLALGVTYVVAAGVALYVLLRRKPLVSHDADDSSDQPRDDEWHEWPSLPLPDEDAGHVLSEVTRSLGAAIVSMRFDRDITKLHVGDVAIATVYLNGVPAPVATKCQWAMDITGIVSVAQSTTTPGLNRITALKVGTVQLVAILGTGVYAWPPAVVTVAAAVVPVPPPMPPVLSPAPAALWSGLFSPLRVMMTDFYYNWLVSMYAIVAARYDIFVAMKHPTDIKALNANARNIPYALQWTTIIDAPVMATLPADERLQWAYPHHFKHGGGMIRHFLAAQRTHINSLVETVGKSATLEASVAAGNLATKYLDDFVSWCSTHGISDAAAEAAFLHDAAGKRIMPYIWDSPRRVFDPRDATARAYTIDRLSRIANALGVDGVFLDELGKGGMEPVWKLATGADTLALTAIENAEVSLLAEVRNAMAKTGKQLIVNTASYTFAFDAACADAAGGTHMEQTNNPLSGDLTASTWSFIDARLAKGTIVNMVPPYQFGEYESQVGKTGTQHMDTLRGKLLELASALMVTVNPASLLWLSIENGDWAKYTPVTNWLHQIDAISKLGLPLEKRARLTVGSGVNGSTRRCFERRFEHGLVVYNAIYNDIWNRASQDYGTDQVTIYLPTDRTYYRVQSDGTLASFGSTSVTLRTPEAAIFVTKQ